jgi:hypothetical protein
MSLAIRLTPETVRTLGFAAIGAAYVGIGATMSRPIRMLVLQNLTDALLMFSFDGINDHLPLPANGYLALDITANKTITQGFFLAEGQRLYCRHLGVAPTVRSTYLTTFYGAEI